MRRRYVRILFVYPYVLNFTYLHERSRIPLTDEQVTMIQERIYEYRHALSATRPAIVQECIEEVKRTWAGGVDFNRELIEKVRAQPQLGFPS